MFKRILKIVHLTSPLDEKLFFKKQKNLQTRLLVSISVSILNLMLRASRLA